MSDFKVGDRVLVPGVVVAVLDQHRIDVDLKYPGCRQTLRIQDILPAPPSYRPAKPEDAGKGLKCRCRDNDGGGTWSDDKRRRETWDLILLTVSPKGTFICWDVEEEVSTEWDYCEVLD